jgi:hypothetical protein
MIRNERHVRSGKNSTPLHFKGKTKAEKCRSILCPQSKSFTGTSISTPHLPTRRVPNVSRCGNLTPPHLRGSERDAGAHGPSHLDTGERCGCPRSLAFGHRGEMQIGRAPRLPHLKALNTTTSHDPLTGAGAHGPSHLGIGERCRCANSRLFTEKAHHEIAKATSASTTFDNTAIQFDITNASSVSLLTFYVGRDPERCQSSYARTTIPGSSIGDISPCVEPLFILSSQSFTNERRTYQIARTRSASIWHGMPTALVRNKPSQS